MSAFTWAGRRTTLIASGAASLLVAGILSASSAAQAAPSTKYYTASVSPTAVDASISGQAFTLTLTNCGASSACCSRTSHQTLGSANIQVDPAFGNVSATVVTPGWFIQSTSNGLIQLRSNNSTYLIPGQSLNIAVTADTPAGVGAYTWVTEVKQSNNFSGSGNDFTISGSQPQVFVGLPDHLAFVTQPSTVQASTKSSPSYMSTAPSVQVVEKDGTPVTVGAAQVALAADTAHGNPGLGGCTNVAAVDGLATFGPGCLTASNVGGGYQLRATATWSYGNYQVSLSTTQDSDAFDVVQVLTTCAAGAPCGATTNGTHTSVSVSASSAPTVDQLEIAVGVDSPQACLPFTPPNGLQVTRVLLDNRDKTITLTFDKYLVNQVPNNGTPFYTMCFAAPWGNWLTASGSTPTFNTDSNEYVGILPDCTAAELAPQNPCVQSRSKHAANEIVTVSVPYQDGRADPKLW
jgi:hypothetical protein